eukprot:g1186.t1
MSCSCHAIAPLECARGRLLDGSSGHNPNAVHPETMEPPSDHQHSDVHTAGEDIDRVINATARIKRSRTMIAVAKARGFESETEDDKGIHRLAKPRFDRAHEFCRAVVPRRVYAIDPTTGEKLFDRVTLEPVTRLRRRNDRGEVRLYRVCPANCQYRSIYRSHAALSDFGVGVALYFKNLGLLAGLCLFLFLTHIPVFFCNYSYKRHVLFSSNVSRLVTPEMNTPFPPEFCGFSRTHRHLNQHGHLLYNSSISTSNATTPTPRSALTASDVANPFISIIDLYGGFDYGGLDQASVTSLQYITAIFCIATLLLTIIVSTRVERDEIKKADDRIYSARDFTVMITGVNLPSDPRAYKKFYESRFEGSRVVRAAEKMVDAENRKLYSDELPPARVFVTFDDELDQHRVMRVMAGDWCDRMSMRRDIEHMGSEATIQDRLEACAHEDAPEPSDILWENLDYGWTSRMLRLLLSITQSFIVIVVLCMALLWLTLSAEEAKDASRRSSSTSSSGNIVALTYVDQLQSAGLAAFIVLINFLLPMTIKLTSRSEIHHRESAVQVSILAKLVIARFLNSAVLTFLVTRKTDMLTSKFTRKIQFLMLIDLFSSPLVRLFDIYNLFCRYVYAPRVAKTQVQLNRYFNGTFWNLAERYTDMMKKVFFTFFYAWLVPSGFLITSIALCFDYIVDKYLLLRRWRTPPRIHSHLS